MGTEAIRHHLQDGRDNGNRAEFQFGMNWSEYAHFVRDIFGIPLAVEALTTTAAAIAGQFLHH